MILCKFASFCLYTKSRFVFCISFTYILYFIQVILAARY